LHRLIAPALAGAFLFDYPIGAAEQRNRESETERLRGLEIDDQFNFRGLLHRQVGRPFTPLRTPQAQREAAAATASAPNGGRRFVRVGITACG
jgi:hypothetical protein